LAPEDLGILVDELRLRPMQFCMFLAALYNEERMEQIMTASVKQVKELRAKRRESLGPKARGRRRVIQRAIASRSDCPMATRDSKVHFHAGCGGNDVGRKIRRCAGRLAWLREQPIP
jgi:hypothetical protein